MSGMDEAGPEYLGSGVKALMSEYILSVCTEPYI